MQCETCGKNISLPTHKIVIIDTLIKEYLCPKCGFKNITRRYGHTLEINGKRTYLDEVFDYTEATRSEAKERRNRHLLSEITTH